MGVIQRLPMWPSVLKSSSLDIDPLSVVSLAGISFFFVAVCGAEQLERPGCL